jgi:SAM-dependent methyltransferase
VNIEANLANSHKKQDPAAHCRLCGEQLTRTLVDLGMSPLCESILTRDDLDEMEAYFPLRVLLCDHCFLAQLREYVAPGHIFRRYAYFSSYSTSWVAHAETYCAMIEQRLCLGRDSLVVELASNDGYLLQHFVPRGIPILGIEPAANVAAVALEKGIPTCIDFFGLKLATELAVTRGQADLIIGNNVIAQLPDLHDFTSGMARLLKPDGVITLEFPHLQRLVEGNQFDTIYHEHFSYFSFGAMERLAVRHGLKLIDVEELPTHGGSLRVYLARADSRHHVASAVAELISREESLGDGSLAAYESFGPRVRVAKRKLLSLLIELKDAGKRICGYGAPGKGNTLLNYCGIGTDFLDFTVDRNPHKHGKFTPGMHIPIHPIEAIREARPEYILILPWNLTHEIIQQMDYVADWGAKFINPIPEARIIDPRELCS